MATMPVASSHPKRQTSFTDKLGNIGHEGGFVIVPVLGDNEFPQLAVAEVIEVITRSTNTHLPELSVRTRVPGDESGIYQAYEIVVLPATPDTHV